MAVEDPDELYGLALERFIPERQALVKALRGAGNKEEAARVAALRKPSVAAWAINQLVRTQHNAVSELFAAGDQAQQAQANLIAGSGDGPALRDAAHRERDAVDALVRSARGLLSAGGQELSPTMLERVTETLHAAALDADARAQVKDGRLERELRHVGLVGAMQAAPRRSTAAPPQPELAVKNHAAKAAKAATAAEEARQEARRAARSAEAAARRRLERTRRALKSAQERRELAAETLEQAEEALAAAEAEAHAAAQEHRRAAAELENA